MFYTSLRTHRHEKHANRNYGLKETATERSIHKRKNKTINFACFNNIKAYINWIKSNLDLNYKTNHILFIKPSSIIIVQIRVETMKFQN